MILYANAPVSSTCEMCVSRCRTRSQPGPKTAGSVSAAISRAWLAGSPAAVIGNPGRCRCDILSRGNSAAGFEKFLRLRPFIDIGQPYLRLPGVEYTKRKLIPRAGSGCLAAEPAPQADIPRQGCLGATAKGGSMQLKSILAAAGLAALAGFISSPALAQMPTADRRHACLRGMPREVAQHDDADGARREQRRQAAAPARPATVTRRLHVKDPTKNRPVNALNTKDATPEQKTAVCMTCHAGQRQLSAWASGVHKKYDVSCTDCHAVHGGQAGRQLQERPGGTVRGGALRDDRAASSRTRPASRATATRAPRS